MLWNLKVILLFVTFNTKDPVAIHRTKIQQHSCSIGSYNLYLDFILS